MSTSANSGIATFLCGLYKPHRGRCAACGRGIRWGTRLCEACEHAEAEAWDYEGCGSEPLAAHGAEWKSANPLREHHGRTSGSAIRAAAANECVPGYQTQLAYSRRKTAARRAANPRNCAACGQSLGPVHGSRRYCVGGCRQESAK